MNQFRLTTPHSLKEQRDKGVRLGEVFSMSHLYFKYYTMYFDFWYLLKSNSTIFCLKETMKNYRVVDTFPNQKTKDSSTLMGVLIAKMGK